MKAQELQQRMSLLPLPPEHGTYWQHQAYILQNYVLGMGLDLNGFLTWPAINGTMFVGDNPQLQEELGLLQHLREWYRYEQAAREDNIGGSEPSKLAPGTNTNLLHQAYHLSHWEQVSGRAIKSISSVLEIGGGYGSMAKVCRNLGFAGDYFMIDLPEFLLLQEFYLSQTIGTQKIKFISDPGKLPASVELIIGIYSLSEMPVSEREAVLGICDASNYLLAFMDNYDGVDNNSYFADFSKKYQLEWNWLKAAGMPTCHYLVGIPGGSLA